jgi:hypothetical protein
LRFEMGRYKSILKAENDARRLFHTVDIPVPGHGLGKRLDDMTDWLLKNAKCEWATHGHLEQGRHIARYYFESPWDAHRFEGQFAQDAGSGNS